jgi:hypothetical protein
MPRTLLRVGDGHWKLDVGAVVSAVLSLGDTEYLVSFVWFFSNR